MEKFKEVKSFAENESSMSVQHLMDIAQAAGEMLDIVEPDKDMEDWIDTKIARAKQDLLDVLHYLKNNPHANATASSKKKVSDYQIDDLGVEHSQYFQGVGVMGTKYDEVFTGIGDSAKEAVEDALDQMADIYEIPEMLEKDALGLSDKNEVQKFLEEADADEVPEVAQELHYYVAVYVKNS